MGFADYRKEKNCTLQQCAMELGLSPNSAGHLSRIETGAREATIPIALQIEAWSDGAVAADSLLSEDDAKLLANHRRLNARSARRQEPEGVGA